MPLFSFYEEREHLLFLCFRHYYFDASVNRISFDKQHLELLFEYIVKC